MQTATGASGVIGASEAAIGASDVVFPASFELVVGQPASRRQAKKRLELECMGRACLSPRRARNSVGAQLKKLFM